jgi:hypothetical protein
MSSAALRRARRVWSAVPPITACPACAHFNRDPTGMQLGFGVCRLFGEAAHRDGSCIWGKRTAEAHRSRRLVVPAEAIAKEA